MSKEEQSNNKKISIIIVYGHTPLDIFYYPTQVKVGTTIQEAVDNSPLLKMYPDLDFTILAYAIYGRKENPQRVLEEGERIEILRPRTYNPRKSLLRTKQLEKEKEKEKKNKE